jgi:hypothetical protein
LKLWLLFAFATFVVVILLGLYSDGDNPLVQVLAAPMMLTFFGVSIAFIKRFFGWFVAWADKATKNWPKLVCSLFGMNVATRGRE